MKDKKEKDYSIIIITVTSVIIIIVAWLYNYFSLKDLSCDERGTFGDMFGSVNAIFSGLALTGIIITILLQRKELRLQREELHQTRIEFLLNRTTTLAYNQLERFEASIKNFEITYGGGCHYKGHNAIVELYKVYEAHYDSKDKSLEENKQSKIALNAKYSKMLNRNRDEVENFSHNIYNSVQALESIIYKSTLEIEDLNNIKNIFFENIGFITMNAIENIINNTTEQLEVFETNDYIKHNIDIGEMQHSIIFLKPVIEFYNARLTEENFDELKEKWKSKKGNNY